MSDKFEDVVFSWQAGCLLVSKTSNGREQLQQLKQCTDRVFQLNGNVAAQLGARVCVYTRAGLAAAVVVGRVGPGPDFDQFIWHDNNQPCLVNISSGCAEVSRMLEPGAFYFR